VSHVFTRRRFGAIAAGIASIAGAPLAFAQAADARFPSRPIRVIVPYPAGGNADNIARVYAKGLSEVTGVPVLVDNRGGASGTIGAEAVHRADADGYTLLLTVTTQLTSPGPGVKPNYNAVTDFIPVAGLCITPLAFVVPASLGVASLKELEALSRNRRVSYGSYGPATSTHVLQHLLYKAFGAKDAVHVPYRGESPMVTDMLAGQIESGFVGIGQAREMEKSGRMKALAVVGPVRSEFLPNVATLREQGHPALDLSYGVAVYASSRTAPETLKKLQESSRQVMTAAETARAYRDQSNQPWTNYDLEDLRRRLSSDTANWNKLVSQLGSAQ
jgi:tripartite-type tricarboxylate transporter receptor subunit TctC